MKIREPIGHGDPYSPMRLPDGTVAPDGRAFIAGYLVQRYGWINDPSKPPTSASAQAFAAEVYERYPAITNDDHVVLPELANIMLSYCGDPHDFDVVGAALAILVYIDRSS